MMKQIIIFLFFLLLMVGSCSNDHVAMSRLSHIDSLMEKSPQMAYDSLFQDSSFFFETGERSVGMKFRLLMAKAQNLLYLQMAPDTLFRDVVTYYELQGTSNEKMMAHYLMGCIYREQKEAPNAVQCYEKAIEYADTLSDDCDFVTLYRIYGQLADVYRKQFLFAEAINAEHKYCDYALKAKNMVDHIGGKEQLASYYYSLGDTAKAIAQIQECISLYKKNNMVKEAVAAVPLLINIHLKRLQLEEAHRLMQVFEKESGLFDANGEICSGREYYYSVKGQYFLETEQLDSAKIYFKKLDKAGFHFEEYKGLLAICIKQKDKKGVVKYAGLCEKEMDKILREKQSEAVLQVTSMYNFNKIQQEKSKQALAKERAEWIQMLLGMVVLLLSFGVVFLFKWYRGKLKHKQNEIEIWNDKYLITSSELERYKEDLALLQCNKEAEISKQQHEIDRLQNEMQGYIEEYKKMNIAENSVIIDDNVVYKYFKKIASGTAIGVLPNDVDWKKLRNVVAENFPLFFKMISHNKKGKSLSQMELRVALLARLHFTSSEMAKVLDTSPASVSNIKQSTNEKLYGDKNARTLLKNMLC